MPASQWSPTTCCRKLCFNPRPGLATGATRTQESIRLGESEGKTFYEIIEASYPFGWRSFDHACLEAYEQGIITEEIALHFCTKRSVVARGIDNIKKTRGELNETAGSLRMKAPIVIPASAKTGTKTNPTPAASSPLLKIK